IRLSGTGTDSATIRIYLERFMPKDGDLHVDPQAALQPVASAMATLSRLSEICDRTTPNVIT
ncbi:MAG: alpha-D-glucose phosphate-specific phosphoglucomutase, partial [Pseudomonadota bacterium]